MNYRRKSADFKGLLNHETPQAPNSDKEIQQRRDSKKKSLQEVDRGDDGPVSEVLELHQRIRQQIARIATEADSSRAGAGTKEPALRGDREQHNQLKSLSFSYEELENLRVGAHHQRSLHQARISKITNMAAGERYWSPKVRGARALVDGNGKLLDLEISAQMWRSESVHEIEKALLSAINQARATAATQWQALYSQENKSQDR
ncbi:hypothetical protein [Actinomadura sp. WMMB 499]|uniref:hypothetical protein n=1 Tax=Actinomadura sp. WMMB 499 TaxID=1219491 RepID=UPI001248C7F8|nr:hypothetical protein [Actinomadura sp. WMMB 499]QFG21672.1 hypothetical protein F7P10_11515 [Actinomadura sp. WMMB 499]